MSINKGLFTSIRQDWTTPDWLFKYLDAKYAFTLDAAASADNHKCPRYYTEDDNSLTKSWAGENVFLNPPYSRGIQDQFIKYCYDQTQKKDCDLIVCLIPARTDTRCFHDYIMNSAYSIEFLKGRLHFGNSKNSAPFPSMIVTWYNYRNQLYQNYHGPICTSLDTRAIKAQYDIP